MLRGIDVSSVQGSVPFAKLAAMDIRFCIAKCQQGNDGKDPFFERNIKACAEHGIVSGEYHFAYPLPHLDPKKQAEGFFAASKGAADLPPFIDAEWPEPAVKDPATGALKYPWRKWGCTASQISDFLAACCARMTELFGRKPIIYTYPWWWAEVAKAGDASVAWAADYPLWMASYKTGWPKQGEKPAIPKPWKDWLFWQFDGNGGLRFPNGVDADFNVFNGTEVNLQAWAAGQSAPAPVPTRFDFTKMADVQARLREFGFDPGPIDGVFGSKTRAAVVGFQFSRGLVADGIVGPKTRDALAKG